MDRSRGTQRNAKPPGISPTTLVTIGAFLIAGIFAVLILKDRSGGGSNSTPTATAVALVSTVTSAPPPGTPAPTATALPATPAAALEPTSGPLYGQPNDPDVSSAVESLLQNTDGVYGVVIMKPDGSVLYSRNSETPFVSASLYKLVLLADIYRKIESGAVAKSDQLQVLDSYFDPENGEDSYFTPDNVGSNFTVERVLFAAGAYSSNVAAKMLLTLTTHQSLATEADLLGMTNTHLFVDPTTLPNWPPAAAPDSSGADIAAATAFDLNDASNGSTNLTTPADIARYFQLLLDGKIVSKAASAEILDILKTQMVDNRFPVLLPEGTEMAHKTGDLDHVVHDAGVIYAPDGPIILVSMAEGDSNDDIPIEIEQRLALIAYGDFDIPPIDLAPADASGNAGEGNASSGDGNGSGGNASDDGNAG